MLKRARRIYQQSAGSQGSGSQNQIGDGQAGATASKSRQRNVGSLNLKDSPLMRWAAARVGRGAEASVFQSVAAAAIDELSQHGGSFSSSSLSAKLLLGNVGYVGDMGSHRRTAA